MDKVGSEVHMVVNFDLTDMNQEETPLDRELQATELARIMSASYPDPLIFLGYVVTSPHAERRECFRAFALLATTERSR